MLSNDEFELNCQFESCLAPLADVFALLQGQDSVRLEQAFLVLSTLLSQFESPRLQLVSGRFNMESWYEIAAARLKPMFKAFRKEIVDQLCSRFKLKGTPKEHVLCSASS